MHMLNKFRDGRIVDQDFELNAARPFTGVDDEGEFCLVCPPAYKPHHSRQRDFVYSARPANLSALKDHISNKMRFFKLRLFGIRGIQANFRVRLPGHIRTLYQNQMRRQPVEYLNRNNEWQPLADLRACYVLGCYQDNCSRTFDQTSAAIEHIGRIERSDGRLRVRIREECDHSWSEPQDNGGQECTQCGLWHCSWCDQVVRDMLEHAEAQHAEGEHSEGEHEDQDLAEDGAASAANEPPVQPPAARPQSATVQCFDCHKRVSTL